MFCEFCGNQLKDGSRFCENCGARADTSAPTYPTGNAPGTSDDRYETPYSQPGTSDDRYGTPYSQPGTQYNQPGTTYSRPGMSYYQQAQRNDAGFSVTAKPEMRILGIPVRGKGIWIALGVIVLILIGLFLFTKLGGGKTVTEEDVSARSFTTEESGRDTEREAAPKSEPARGPDEIAGLYKLTEMITEDDGDLAEDLELMESLGLMVTMELRRDGTGSIDFYGEETDEFTWDGDAVYVDGETIPYTYENGVFTMRDDSEMMRFARTTEEELETLKEGGVWGVLDDRTDPADVEGLYTATACFEDGVEVDLDDEYLYLFEDGVGYFHLLESDYAIRWKLDGTEFYFLDEEGDEFVGTLRDGVIDGDYFGGYSYVFEHDSWGSDREHAYSTGHDPFDFTTDDTPSLADFQWVDADIIRGDIPAAYERLDDFEEVTGGWKCYLIDDPDGVYDSMMERFLNVYINGLPGSAAVTFDWFYVYDGAQDEGFDDDASDSYFEGSWEDGQIEAIGSGRVTLTDFWYRDGHEYGVGTFMWPDGVTAAVLLARP